jgi:hypothetical protein
MATRAATGYLSEQHVCNSPVGIVPERVKPNQQTRMVSITSVMSPFLIVPGFKKGPTKNENVSLHDFGAPPFLIVLPLKMLKHHVESPIIRVFSEINPTVKQSVATPTVPPRANAGSVRTAEHGDVLDFSETDDRNKIKRVRKDGDDDVDNENALDANTLVGGTSDGSGNDEIQLLSPDHIDLITLAAAFGTQAELGPLTVCHCEHLDDPPDIIVDCFSACLGDNFHAISRPKVAVKHEYKKPYFVALQNAFFAWRPELLEDVKQVLASNGFANEDIEALMYYDVDFFRQRVDRRVLPPRQLYWRVRAVFAVFGNKEDTKLKKPLFNKRAWAKANNILKEILLGYFSDPPGFQFYSNRLDKKGEPMVDKYGIALLSCNRGTNDVEAIHKQLVTLFGTWCTGVEMSDALLAERRHRHNHKINENKRLGFPRLGHYDTWIIDLIQLLVEKNHNVLLYPDWSNSSDYKPTPESFGTVALHSHELHVALDEVMLPEATTAKFTSEMKYLAKTMSVKVPFLPVHGASEARLFTRLVLEMPTFDDVLMAIEWCKHIDGHLIFPKLPVYLRMYFERWERNQRVKDAVKNSKTELKLLEQVNETNMLHPNSRILEVATPDNEDLVDGFTDDVCGDQDDDIAQSVAVAQAAQTCEASFRSWPSVAIPTPILQPLFSATRSHHQLGAPVVGGVFIGLSDHLYPMKGEKKRGQRGKDIIARKKRTCARCVSFHGTDGLTCRGRIGNLGANACEYFSSTGERLKDSSNML